MIQRVTYTTTATRSVSLMFRGSPRIVSWCNKPIHHHQALSLDYPIQCHGTYMTMCGCSAVRALEDSIGLALRLLHLDGNLPPSVKLVDDGTALENCVFLHRVRVQGAHALRVRLILRASWAFMVSSGGKEARRAPGSCGRCPWFVVRSTRESCTS